MPGGRELARFLTFADTEPDVRAAAAGPS